MSNIFVIKRKINSFYNKTISVSGDKSLSIRWVLLASLANGKSKSFNLLNSDDVKASIEAVKKLGIRVRIKKNFVKFMVRVSTVISTKKILLSMLKIREL